MSIRITSGKLKSLIKVTSTGVVIFAGICMYKGDERFYNEVAMPLTRCLDPEWAHNLGITALKWGLMPKQSTEDSQILKTNFLGLNLNNPIGIAAGFDKQGEAIEGLHKLGFGFVEIGSVTPEPQPGNPKPRVFRLIEDNAVINRYGFNSDGHEIVHSRLAALKSSNFEGVIGVNLGKNKLSEDSIADYTAGLKKFHKLADYFVINISSPNTPGLRNLQNKKFLEELLTSLNNVRQTLDPNPPLLLKIAPDLSEGEKADIADVVTKKKSKVDGLILTNTTVQRKDLNLVSSHKEESGGLSGAPLREMSTQFISDMYKKTAGKVPIIGVGGVFTGQDAYDKIKAGASLVQIYSSFIYHGPPVVWKIKRELKELMEKDGVQSLDELVGKEHKK